MFKRFVSSVKSCNVQNSAIALVCLSVITGCVTVNVNFPESAVQKATDDYVRELYKKKQSEESSSAPTSFLLDLIIPSANAQDKIAAFNTQFSGRTEIIARQKARIASVDKFKTKGAIGESNQGLLVMRDGAKLGKLEKIKVKKLIKEENADRKKLFGKTLSHNKMASSQEPQVAKSFSKSFRAASPSGTWIQSDEGAWSKK